MWVFRSQSPRQSEFDGSPVRRFGGGVDGGGRFGDRRELPGLNLLRVCMARCGLVSEGDFPSGQRGQTVNLMALPSKVRILHPPLGRQNSKHEIPNPKQIPRTKYRNSFEIWSLGFRIFQSLDGCKELYAGCGIGRAGVAQW